MRELAIADELFLRPQTSNLKSQNLTLCQAAKKENAIKWLHTKEKNA
jgi:hypothetical protein